MSSNLSDKMPKDADQRAPSNCFFVPGLHNCLRNYDDLLFAFDWVLVMFFNPFYLLFITISLGLDAENVGDNYNIPEQLSLQNIMSRLDFKEKMPSGEVSVAFELLSRAQKDYYRSGLQ